MKGVDKMRACGGGVHRGSCVCFFTVAVNQSEKWRKSGRAHAAAAAAAAATQSKMHDA